MYYSNSTATGLAIGWIVGGLIACIIFGIVTKHINESKGYEGGFAWGFWLNLIGIIVVACKPDNRSYSNNAKPSYAMSALEEEARERRILSEGGWRCTCGEVNHHYVSTCGCGKNKREVINKKPEDSKPTTEVKQLSEKNDSIDLIKKLAELHSQGILTDEEFETKKAELLSKL